MKNLTKYSENGSYDSNIELDPDGDFYDVEDVDAVLTSLDAELATAEKVIKGLVAASKCPPSLHCTHGDCTLCWTEWAQAEVEDK